MHTRGVHFPARCRLAASRPCGFPLPAMASRPPSRGVPGIRPPLSPESRARARAGAPRGPPFRVSALWKMRRGKYALSATHWLPMSCGVRFVLFFFVFLRSRNNGRDTVMGTVTVRCSRNRRGMGMLFGVMRRPGSRVTVPDGREPPPPAVRRFWERPGREGLAAGTGVVWGLVPGVCGNRVPTGCGAGSGFLEEVRQ